MKKYYCVKCKKYHYRGKIYKNHLRFKNEEKEINQSGPLENKLIPSDKIIDYNIKELRPVARCQIRNLLRKMNITRRNDVYKKEINKIIINEKNM